MQSRAARGRAEIAKNLGDRRKLAGGNAALLREEGNETRVRLVRRKPGGGGARDATAQLDRGENFFHARDCRAGQGFTIELHVEAAILGIAHPDSSRVLPGAAENKFSEKIAAGGSERICAAKQECARAVTEQTTKFS